MVLTQKFPMEPEPDTGEDQLIDEVLQYITTRDSYSTLICKEGRKRVIRTKAKQFEEITLDIMNVHIQAGGCDCGLFNS